MDKIVSVVIPTYNYEKFVLKAIKSVLSQTYSPIECIVVNDGSTDDTIKALEHYKSSIKIINQANKGLSNARNTGINASKGSLIAFLDADDWWDPRKIESQIRVLEDNEKLAAVGCAEYSVDKFQRSNEIVRQRNPTLDRNKNLQDVALRRLWIGGSGSGLLIRRAVFDDIGMFDETLFAAEDWDMWLRIVAKYDFVNLQEPLNYRLWHGTGVFRNVERMEINQRSVYEKAIKRWPDVLNHRIRRKMRALILADAGSEYISNGNFKEAHKKYVNSLKEFPFDIKTLYKLIRISSKVAAQAKQ